MLKRTSLFVILFLCWLNLAFAQRQDFNNDTTIDRVQLVSQQIELLKNRFTQGQLEFRGMQGKPFTVQNVNKKMLDKAALDISVAKSNLDSLNIEVADCQQTIIWLGKSIQEIENQLNLINVFGLSTKKAEIDASALNAEGEQQKKLLVLEKKRIVYLRDLQSLTNNILNLKTDAYNQIGNSLKSRKLLLLNQQQVKDELAYQLQQNHWLEQLNSLYATLSKVDPNNKAQYASLERDIYYANESANVAYSKSLIARYKDQIQQMHLTMLRSSSLSLLNEISDQVLILNKQIQRLEEVLKFRIDVLKKHIDSLQQHKSGEQRQRYISRLLFVANEYQAADGQLDILHSDVTNFRQTLDAALQAELSARQGFPTFTRKSLIDLGREILLVPTLSFQVIKSLSIYVIHGVEATSIGGWLLFILSESLLVTIYLAAKRLFKVLIAGAGEAWRDTLHLNWLTLQWFSNNLLDIFIIINLIWWMFFFGVPAKNYAFLVYLMLVWVIFKSLLIIARCGLLQTTHDSAGDDVLLYHRLKWFIMIGGIVTFLTVGLNLLPMIYDLKMLADRLFLLLMMFFSLLLLRSWNVVPNLVLTQMQSRHPYLQKSVRFIGIVIPVLIFANSIVGLFGYVNLIRSVSWYEGIFLLVLFLYLILRGILTDALEKISRLLIQYVHNGWLWTEAFLKPLDKVLRITLFLSACMMLFILYGWDKQSPIVERSERLLHYQLADVLNTIITPLSIIELIVVISVFYWTAKWTREFVYRLLLSRTKDLGLRNSVAILSQYMVVIVGVFICLGVLGIDLRALYAVTGLFLFGVGLGLRDLANNFVCGFLILIERPLRVGDIVTVNNMEGDVAHIGSRAVTIRSWDMMEHYIPNSDIFSKAFTNWTAKDNTVRSIVNLKACIDENPHRIRSLILEVIGTQKQILKEPLPDVYLKEMNDGTLTFELRYYVNIRLIRSRTAVASVLLTSIWDKFTECGIQLPYPIQAIFHQNGLSIEPPVNKI